jgi:small subunit ribosomal protein S6
MSKSLPVDRAYETLLIFPSDIPQKTIDGFIEKIKAALQPSKGVLRSVQVWGRRRLTYPVKHQRDGLYVYIDYTGGAGAPEALKTLFRVTDFVLRHMTTDKVVMRPPYRPRVATPEAGAAGAVAAQPGEQSAGQGGAATATAVENKELPSS